MTESKSPIPIPVRHQNFDLSNKITRDWYDNHVFGTAVFNAVSVMFPQGEQEFINSVKNYRQNVRDPKLKEDIKRFMAQEAQHGAEHVKWNNALRDMGYNVERMERRQAKVERMWKRLGPYSRLTSTMALEHFTAMLAESMLEKEHRNTDPDLLRMWRWHAVEESEHKAVAFDVFNTIKHPFPYPIRIFNYLLATYGFLGQTIFNMKIIFKHDNQKGFALWKSGLSFLWGKNGILRDTAKIYFSYFKPGFHPWDHDNHHLVDQWSEEVGLHAKIT